MANAFSDGRISLWHSSPKSFNLNYDKVAKWGVTDIMAPAHEATTTLMSDIRSKTSGDGVKFRAHISVDGTHGETGRQIFDQTLAAITKLKPGVAEINIEGENDNEIGKAAREFLTLFRQGPAWRFAFPLCINVVPMKAYVLPLDLMNWDQNTYGRIQLFYGAEMRLADPDECRWDWTVRGFPADRLTFMYSAKARRQSDNSVLCDLPVFSDRGEYVRKLRRGAIFNANEMLNAGLI